MSSSVVQLRSKFWLLRVLNHCGSIELCIRNTSDTRNITLHPLEMQMSGKNFARV